MTQEVVNYMRETAQTQRMLGLREKFFGSFGKAAQGLTEGLAINPEAKAAIKPLMATIQIGTELFKGIKAIGVILGGPAAPVAGLAVAAASAATTGPSATP